MGMRIEHRLEQKLSQELRVTPQMILMNRVLQLQRLELRQEIEQNLKENPALEIVEEITCPKCGEPLGEGGICRSCESNVEYTKQDANENRERNFDDLVSNWDSGHYEDSTTYEKISQNEEFDPITNTAYEFSINDEIKHNFLLTYPNLPEIQNDIARYMIDMIDEKGLIQVDDNSIVETTDFLLEDVQLVRDLIMHLDPAGLGAVNATQAMMIQLDILSETLGKDVSLEKQIILNYRDLLARDNCEKIAKDMNIDSQMVKDACEFIKQKLYAYPGDFFERPSEQEYDPDFYPEPDVIICRVDGDFYPEIVDSGMPNFKISGFYMDAYQKIKSGRGDEFTEEEKKHIRQYFERAKFFLDCINQRRETITRICNFLIKYQRDFLEQDIRRLKDLTREKVAEEIGFHPSTISRALKDKYVQLPNREIHSFNIFFDYQKVLILVIKEILEKEESPANMLSDEMIANRMKALGFDVARRTVAKYRERGRIPPKNIRKRKLIDKWEKLGLLKKKQQ